MEWWQILGLMFASLVFLMAIGLPVAFSFGLLNVIFAFWMVGGASSLRLVAISSYSSIATFAVVAVPLFILMGEIILHSGMATMAINGVSKWVGKVPGRLGVMSILSGTVFAAASGSSMASVATIGSTMVPEMHSHGYNKGLSTGVVATSGALAVLIPPSGLMVIFGSISQQAVGDLLIAGIIPGLILSSMLLAYTIGISALRPAMAPAMDVGEVNWMDRLVSLREFIPIIVLVLVVIGSIFFGVATPTESAAMGAAGALVLAAAYRKLNWHMLKVSFSSTAIVAGFSLLIITSSTAFSQILAFTQAANGLSNFVTDLPLPPIVIIILMQIVILVMGGFMDSLSIMLITVPIFFPVVSALGFDLLWFSIVTMVNIELGLITPPFGLNLFVLKGVAPPDITLMDIFRGITPFVGLNIATLVIVLFVPGTATLLPGLMR